MHPYQPSVMSQVALMPLPLKESANKVGPAARETKKRISIQGVTAAVVQSKASMNGMNDG